MADITEVEYIWKNGEMIPWAEATTHILSHSLHYGSGVFEGIRCYQNPENGYSVMRVKVKGYDDLVTLVGNLLEVPAGSVLY